MSTNPFSKSQAREDAPVVQRATPSPRLLVSTGLDEYWVHCAVCGAEPDGHWSTGEVRWTRGTVTVIPGGQKNEFAYACRCSAGQQLHEHQRIPFFDEVEDLASATFRCDIPNVVKLRDQALPVPGLADRERLNNACFAQVQRFFKGEIDAKGLAQNVDALLDRTAPHRQPTLLIDDLLLSPELWSRYFPGVPYPARLGPRAVHRDGVLRSQSS